MTDPFEKSEEQSRHLKIGVTGPISSGKTCFGLDAKNHGLGPVAVISVEGGDIQFESSTRWGGFKPLRTQNIADMKEAIEFLEKNPGRYGTLLVDTITGIYEAVVDAKMKDDGSMNRNTWGIAKRAWKSLMLRLVNLPMNVVFVVHELDVTKTDKEGNTEVVGQKLDAEKTFGRAPDFLIRMTGIRNKKAYAQVLKICGEDTGFYVGQTIEDPNIGMFVAAIKKKGASEARISTPEEVKESNEAAIEKKSEPVDRTTDELLATQLVVACEKGFKAKTHADNWLKKHRDEIGGLKARQPDLYAAVKAAYDAAQAAKESKSDAANEPQEAA